MANYPDTRKNYAARRAPPPSKTNGVGLIVLSFLLGYIFSWLYSPMLLASWFKTHVNPPPVEKPSNAVLQKPKFEFYTLLTQEKVQPPKMIPPPAINIPSSVAPSPVVKTTGERDQHQQIHYVLQLASFQRREDAEQMLAGLVMRGFEVNIKSITQQGTAWHRVVMGPFTSKLQAEKAQGAIAQSERISGIIRRMES